MCTLARTDNFTHDRIHAVIMSLYEIFRVINIHFFLKIRNVNHAIPCSYSCSFLNISTVLVSSRNVSHGIPVFRLRNQFKVHVGFIAPLHLNYLFILLFLFNYSA